MSHGPIVIYKIFDPLTITYEYYDAYGALYAVIPTDAIVSERPFTYDEAMSALRKERTRRLEACDYTQLADVGIDPVTVEAWRVYRQQLRDITDGLVWNVTTWPDKPV
jgi:hypothetical protein